MPLFRRCPLCVGKVEVIMGCSVGQCGVCCRTFEPSHWASVALSLFLLLLNAALLGAGQIGFSALLIAALILRGMFLDFLDLCLLPLSCAD